jgi:hypothetical protein
VDAATNPDAAQYEDAATEEDGATQPDAAQQEDAAADIDGEAEQDAETEQDGDIPTGWTLVTSPTSETLRDVWMATSSFGVAVGDNGTVITYDGSNWSTVGSVPTSEDLYGVWGSDASNVYAAGNGGTIIHWDGSDWTDVSPAANTNFRDIGGAGSTVIAVGSGVYMSTGGAFSQEDTGATQTLYGAWGTGSTLFLVGLSGTIIQGQGGNWSTMTTPNSEWLTGISGLSSSEMWASGDDGMIMGYDGSNWTEETSSTSAHVRRVWAGDASNIYAAGYDTSQPTSEGGFILKRDAGPTWQTVTIPTCGNLWSIHGADTSEIWAVGWNGDILRGP